MPRLVLIHVLLQGPPGSRLGLDQQVFRDVHVEAVRLGSDPGHLELKVSVLVIVVNEVNTDTETQVHVSCGVSSSLLSCS